MIPTISDVMQSWVVGIVQQEIEASSLWKYKDLFVWSGSTPDVTAAMQQWVTDVTAPGMPICAALKIPAGTF